MFVTIQYIFCERINCLNTTEQNIKTNDERERGERDGDNKDKIVVVNTSHLFLICILHLVTKIRLIHKKKVEHIN